jgi:hypothetical protein
MTDQKRRVWITAKNHQTGHEISAPIDDDEAYDETVADLQAHGYVVTDSHPIYKAELDAHFERQGR